MLLGEIPNYADWSLWICDHRAQMNTQPCRSILLCFFFFGKFIFLLSEAMILMLYSLFWIFEYFLSHPMFNRWQSCSGENCIHVSSPRLPEPSLLSTSPRLYTHGPCFSPRHWLVHSLFLSGLRGHCDIVSASSGYFFATVSFPSAYKCGAVVSIFKRKTLFLTLFFLSAIFLLPRQKNSLKNLPRLGVSVCFPLILFFERYFNHYFLPIPPVESLSTCPPLTFSLPKLVSVICVHLIRPLSSTVTPYLLPGH